MAKRKPNLKELQQQLRERWTDDRAQEVSDWLYAKRPGACPMGVVEVNGVEYADLRGLRAIGAQVPHGAVLDRIDFSHGELYFVNCQVSDCLFIRTIWDGCGVGQFFERCDFTRARFKSAGLSESIFVDCEFADANLQQCFGNKASFHRCNLRGADFRNASLGILKECATMFACCDLTGAKFGWRIRGYREDDSQQNPQRPQWLSGVRFVDCTLDEIDWGGCDTSAAEFQPYDQRPVYE